MKTKEQAIKELKCEEKKCKYFDKDGAWTFCKAVFTDHCCTNKKKDKYYHVFTVDGTKLYAKEEIDICCCDGSPHIAGLGCW